MHDNKLNDKLRRLYLVKYEKLRNDSCGVFKESCDFILNKLFDFIPSNDEVMKILGNGAGKFDALEICYNRLRLNIIDAFLSLDTDLSGLIRSMKNEVLDIFRGETLRQNQRSCQNDKFL